MDGSPDGNRRAGPTSNPSISGNPRPHKRKRSGEVNGASIEIEDVLRTARDMGRVDHAMAPPAAQLTSVPQVADVAVVHRELLPHQQQFFQSNPHSSAASSLGHEFKDDGLSVLGQGMALTQQVHPHNALAEAFIRQEQLHRIRLEQDLIRQQQQARNLLLGSYTLPNARGLSNPLRATDILRAAGAAGAAGNQDSLSLALGRLQARHDLDALQYIRSAEQQRLLEETLRRQLLESSLIGRHTFPPATASPLAASLMQNRDSLQLQDPSVSLSTPASDSYHDAVANRDSPLTSSVDCLSLFLPTDEKKLSPYQILVRKQLEFFVAGREDVESNTQGRKKRVRLNQVGLRCRHCAKTAVRKRARGAVYYPAKMSGVYQAAQNMATSHLGESCPEIYPQIRQRLLALRERRDTATGGKKYWAESCESLGIYETEEGLRLRQTGSEALLKSDK